MRKIVLAVALAIVGGGAHAGSTFDTRGTGKRMAQNEIIPVTENHMIVDSRTVYDTMEMSDADHPFNGATGTCFGAIEIHAPAGATGGGNCAFTDGDGDVSMNRWSVRGMTAEGALFGSWTVVGGTGKYADATGGGGYETTTDSETGAIENVFDGAVTLR